MKTKFNKFSSKVDLHLNILKISSFQMATVKSVDHLLGKTLESALNVVDIQNTTPDKEIFQMDVQKTAPKKELFPSDVQKTTPKKENFLKTDLEDEKSIGQRIRKRDRFFRLLKKSSQHPTFYVERPKSEVPTFEVLSCDVEPPSSNDEFVSDICEIGNGENLIEKVKMALENWIGNW